jgi:TIR domain/inactive STAND
MLKLFISYSHRDKDWCEKLMGHLSGLERASLIERWFDGNIRPGDDWNGSISAELENADIIVLLVSPSYMSSVFCGLEVERAMERSDAGQAKVVPVLLEFYNLSGCAFEKLQVFPPPDKPIRSKEWESPDQALSQVSKMIEEIARSWSGAVKKTRLMNPNRDELRTLLHHLCDRRPQKEALVEAFDPTKRRPGRPFIIVLQGGRLDALEQFLNRLQNSILPRFLGSKPGRWSPVFLPEYRSAKTSPQELFCPRLADSLGISPWSTPEQIQAVFKTGSTSSIIPLTIAASEWSESTYRFIERYLTLWEEWPDSPEDRLLLPTITVEYDTGESSSPEIQNRLKRLKVDRRPNLNGVLLPPLPPVPKTDFQRWIQEECVRQLLESPDRAADNLDIILPDNIWPTLMRPLAEVHLPRFLERL